MNAQRTNNKEMDEHSFEQNVTIIFQFEHSHH